MIPKARIVKTSFPFEKVIEDGNKPAEPLYEGSLWWFEHLANQSVRFAEIQAQQEVDRNKAREEAHALYFQLIQAQQQEAEKPTSEEDTSAQMNALFAQYQQQLQREVIASKIVDSALNYHGPENLASTLKQESFLQLFEKIQPFEQGQAPVEEKPILDTETLWSTILARSQTMLGKPSEVVRLSQKTSKNKYLLHNLVLDVAIRKAAKRLSGQLSLPINALETDLVHLVRESPQYRQNFAAVVRFLRDIDEEPWAVCSACGTVNEVPWDECKNKDCEAKYEGPAERE